MVEKLKKKNIIICISIFSIIILFFLIFFIKNNYKNLEIGNNMSNKNIEEIEEYILNISSYEATISVTIESNKNTNKYVLLQKYRKPNKTKQIVLEPKNIEGLEIINDGNNLSINNSKLNINTIYENYEYILENYLCLESFISDYKLNKENESKIFEENEQYILQTKSDNNKYICYKELYIDKKTAKPIKLVIKDINEKNVVYILYNEIKLNDLKENEILALKTKEPYAKLY